ncbi:MAG: metallophosphoesterase, partial [Gemmatimonadota bacterium]
MSASRIACFGGVYSNHLALAATLDDAAATGANQVYCLGDLGAFGPHPDLTCAMIRDAGIPVVQGNYDHALGHDLDDCRCGYTDPRDNHFAALSYGYTYTCTASTHRAWMRTLPCEIRLPFGPHRVVLCHGSPRQMNEFLWDSTCPDQFLAWLLDA